MLAEQDWCLECGTAAPGRLGERPGWRLGAIVLVLTLLLVGGASVAGYAAVTGDAERETAAQNPEPGTPVPAQVPQPPAPERPTSEPPEPVAVEPEPTTDPQPDLSTPDDSFDDSPNIDPVTPLPDVTPNPSPDVGVDDPAGDATGGSEAVELSPFTIRKAGLEVYNPYERAGAEFGDPEDALNTGDPFFDVTVPADGEPIGAGLKVDLGAVREVREITFRTTTPGMGLEIYGVANGNPTGLRAGWRLLDEPELTAGQRDVTVTFDEPKRVRRLVLWFTTPSSPDDPRASLGRLKVLG